MPGRRAAGVRRAWRSAAPFSKPTSRALLLATFCADDHGMRSRTRQRLERWARWEQVPCGGRIRQRVLNGLDAGLYLLAILVESSAHLSQLTE